MNPFLWLITTIIDLYIWILIASAVLSWLVVFNVVNTRNPIVHSVGDFLYRVTEPVLRPIRNRLPSTGGLDLSPIVVIFGIWVAQDVLQRRYMAIAFGQMSGLLL